MSKSAASLNVSKKGDMVNPVSPANRTRVNDTAIHLLKDSPTNRPLLFIIAESAMLQRLALQTLELVDEI